ncbi:MAG TPA: hypothetical protein VL593_00040 [Ramlibacter sp.]|nr:hypothetical protein [Ramlibacter sp.]
MSAALEAFKMRMAGHGFSVSGTLMNYDRNYALEQLRQAHTLADNHLRELAVELFRHFEKQPSGTGRAGYAN